MKYLFDFINNLINWIMLFVFSLLIIVVSFVFVPIAIVFGIIFFVCWGIDALVVVILNAIWKKQGKSRRIHIFTSEK